MTGDKVLKTLCDKIKNRRARIGIVGLGYVGLPLAIAFAKKGFHVTGIDIDAKKVASLKAGRSYVLDIPSKEVQAATRQGRFRAMSDYQAVPSLDAVILCVPTPLNKTKEPDISFILDATQQITKYLKAGQLIALESTSYPGTTEEAMLPLLEQSGLRAEKDFFLAFSPERVDPGNARFDTVSIPKVVGGVGPLSAKAVKALYGSVIKKVVPVSSAKTAEMVKLLENIFRSVNIGLINEVAMIAHRLGVDIWEVIEAAKTKPFGFMPFYPGPGIGGHCLPIDPLYLSWKSRLNGFQARMIELASQINESMPLYIIKRLMVILGEDHASLRGVSVLVLGVTYKKDIDDLRESPAVHVMEYLLREGVHLFYSDPYVETLHVEGMSLRSSKLTPALLKKQQCALILTDHGCFDYRMILRNSKKVFDTRNVLRPLVAVPTPQVHYL